MIESKVRTLTFFVEVELLIPFMPKIDNFDFISLRTEILNAVKSISLCLKYFSHIHFIKIPRRIVVLPLPKSAFTAILAVLLKNASNMYFCSSLHGKVLYQVNFS